MPLHYIFNSSPPNCFKPDRKLKARWQLALQQAIRGVRTQPDELSAPLGDHPLETLMQALSELKACMEA